MKYLALFLVLLFLQVIPGCRGPAELSAEEKSYVATWKSTVDKLKANKIAPAVATVTTLDERLLALADIEASYRKAPVPPRFDQANALLLLVINEHQELFQSLKKQQEHFTAENSAEGKRHWKKADEFLEQSTRALQEAVQEAGGSIS